MPIILLVLGKRNTNHHPSPTTEGKPTMSARPVVKTSLMPQEMQEAAIQVAQDAIRDNNTEQVSMRHLEVENGRIGLAVYSMVL